MGSILVQNLIRASLHLVPTVSWEDVSNFKVVKVSIFLFANTEIATAIEEVVVSRSEIRRIDDDGFI